jgi:rubredoxin
MTDETQPAHWACPQCQQIDQAASVPAVVEAGTSAYAGRSDTIGFGSGISVGGGGLASTYGVSRSVGTQSGTLQSSLASTLAPAPPPFARTEKGTCLSTMVFVVAFPAWVVWFLAIWIEASRRNKRVDQGRPAALAIWNHAWYCHRCGGAYFPAAGADIPPNVPRQTLLEPAAFQQLVWNAGGYDDLLGIAR